MRTRNSIRGFVRPLVGRSVTLELKSGKTRISAPAHLSATGGRVSGLVLCLFLQISTMELRLSVPANLHTHHLNKAGYTATSCGQVGRGGNGRFATFQLERDGPTNQTDQPTDQPTNGRTKPLMSATKKRAQTALIKTASNASLRSRLL